MKHKIENIICVLLALSVAGIVAYNLYSKRVSEWKEVAWHVLKDVVDAEIEKRIQEESMPIFSQGNYRPVVESDFPLTINFKTEQGSRLHTITWEDSQRNITQDQDMRVLHTMLFLNHPLSVDTLDRTWNDCLRITGFPGEGLLCVCTLDLNSGTKHRVCADGSWDMAQVDSLSQFSMGHACETEVTGFVSYRWWQVYAVTDWVILLLLLLSGGGLTLLWRKIPAIKRRYFTKTVEIEKKVEIEKPVMVATVELSQATCCRLPDGTLFDRERHILKKGDKQKKLAVQDCTLLCLLVEAKDKGVPIERLKEVMWSSKIDSNNALYVNVCRLRKNLREISMLTIKNIHGYYCLVYATEED